MKRILAATAISLTMGEPLMAQEGSGGGAMPASASSLSVSDILSVSPALGRYAEEDVLGNLWQRPQLSRRDRSIVTLAVLIARNQAIDLKHYIDVALDSGVTSTEVSEIITHLAFYSGWSNAMSAVAATKDVFKDRGITTDQLPAASPQLLPLNEEAERQRATGVERMSVRSLRGSCSSQPTRCSSISGSGRALHRETAAS
ncbi:alkylhydroperoxidase/carboxymuconolactone decarboxylase family protein YurZ [Rhizobium leguminosarum]|nr:4-carboxymuconolactone decarboxylase [Rhizobium leguminosarum]MDH6272979.1 alkylhydroperoxidase/carboxymuconolactone decarboxylase family protein YurZ [Rhizobium leguminosarum]